MESILRRANAKVTVGTAAWLLSGSYLLSALLGLFRERLLATNFGISATLDAYFVAFSIPDLIFFALTSGALTVTFLPVLTDRLLNYNKKSAWELSSSLINLLALVTLAAGVLFFIFASPLMWLAAPGFDQAQHELAVTLTRILALNPMIFAISSVIGTIQHAYGRFFFYALAPVLYNLGIIFGILVLSTNFGIQGVVWGAVLGALAQLLIQVVGLAGLGFRYRALIFWRNRGFKQVLRLIPARSLDEGIDHLLAVVERAIASGLGVAAVAAYQYAFTLKNVPISLIGTAIATAVFPKISERAAGTRSDLFKKDLLDTIKLILWLAIPAAVLAVILRGYLVRLLVGDGNPVIASVLGWFAVAIVFQSLLRLVARAFYAHQDTKRPLYASLIAITVNIGLAYYLATIYGVPGLAMAQSTVAVLEVSVLLVLLRRKIGPLLDISVISSGLKTALASLALGGTAYSMVRYVFPLLAADVGFFTLAPKFATIVIVSVITYVIVGAILRQPEALRVVTRASRIVFKQVRVET